MAGRKQKVGLSRRETCQQLESSLQVQFINHIHVYSVMLFEIFFGSTAVTADGNMEGPIAELMYSLLAKRGKSSALIPLPKKNATRRVFVWTSLRLYSRNTHSTRWVHSAHPLADVPFVPVSLFCLL